LNEDGSFTYTPPRNFSGPDQFTYLANDGTLDSAPTIVTLEFDPPPVSIRLELTDVEGNEIREVVDGQRLYVQVWVQDLRGDTHPDRGIQAAYLDLIYDPASFQPILDSQLPLGFEMIVGADFLSPGSGDASLPGLIDEVGSIQQGATPLGHGEVLLLTIPFDVSAPRAADDTYELNQGSSDTPLDVLVNDLQLAWSADFVPEAADLSPDSDLLLFGSAVPVNELDVRFADASAAVRNEQSLFISQVDSPDQGGLAEISADGSRIIYTPAPGFSGDETFVYTVSNSSGRVARAEVTVTVVSSWQNVRDPLDVNDDGVIVPLDALLVINDLNANGARELLEPSTGPPYLDVNGDGFVSSIDALLIINYLNFVVGGGEAEGEAGVPGPIDTRGAELVEVEAAGPVDALAAPEVAWQEGFLDLIAWLAQRYGRRRF
jgi:hypothetical protein